MQKFDQTEGSVTGSLPPSTDIPSLLNGVSQGFLLEKYKWTRLTSAVGLHGAPTDEIHFNNLCTQLTTAPETGKHWRSLLTDSEDADSQQVNTPSLSVYGTKYIQIVRQRCTIIYFFFTVSSLLTTFPRQAFYRTNNIQINWNASAGAKQWPREAGSWFGWEPIGAERMWQAAERCRAQWSLPAGAQTRGKRTPRGSPGEHPGNFILGRTVRGNFSGARSPSPSPASSGAGWRGGELRGKGRSAGGLGAETWKARGRSGRDHLPAGARRRRLAGRDRRPWRSAAGRWWAGAAGSCSSRTRTASPGTAAARRRRRPPPLRPPPRRGPAGSGAAASPPATSGRLAGRRPSEPGRGCAARSPAAARVPPPRRLASLAARALNCAQEPRSGQSSSPQAGRWRAGEGRAAASGAAPGADAAATAREGAGATGGPGPASPHPASRSQASTHRRPPTAELVEAGGWRVGRNAGSGGRGAPAAPHPGVPSFRPPTLSYSAVHLLYTASEHRLGVPTPCPPLPTVPRGLRGLLASSPLTPSAAGKGTPTL